jgi:hypothetical protein
MSRPDNRSPHQAGELGRAGNDLRYAEHAQGNKPQVEAQAVLRKPMTVAGAYLCRRFHVNPVIADLVASLAGIGPDRRAA